MAAVIVILALLIQNCLTETVLDDDNLSESREILKTKLDVEDVYVKEYQAAPEDWMDAFIGSSSSIFPTSSTTLMAQATFSDKSPEEQLEDIKKMANQITNAIQSEITNLLSFAISSTSKEDTDNTQRKKRSVETPLDSSQLVMRLLKHIKSNNEYQNIAIEKMMTAQEIADKFGISFTPDPETLSDLAVAANEQAQEMSEILKDAREFQNITQTSLNNIEQKNNQINSNNNLKEFVQLSENKQFNASKHISNNQVPNDILLNDDQHDRIASSHYNCYYPIESQIVTPPPQHYNAPVSQRPNFYDFVPYNPTSDYGYGPYCSMEPLTATNSIILPIDEPMHPKPELVAEEYEETVTSKVYIDHDEEPGVSTVNHVMSYTVSEKSHFRSPHIESLPQQMQYYFFLM